jgi:hypothetical protein
MKRDWRAHRAIHLGFGFAASSHRGEGRIFHGAVCGMVYRITSFQKSLGGCGSGCTEITKWGYAYISHGYAGNGVRKDEGRNARS